MSFRVGVLVSGEGSNLQALIDRVHAREGIEIACVGSNRADARALERATAAGIETGVFRAEDHADREVRDRAVADWLDAREVDLVVLAGWMHLLSPEFVRRFHGRLINVHPSLLPAFPGLRPIEEAVAHGVRVSGVTVHFVDEGVDSGPILLQEPFELPYAAAIEEVKDTAHAIEHELLPRAVQLIARGTVRLDPENPRRVVIDEAAVAGD